MSDKARETLLKDPVKINSIKRLNEIYKEDPDIYSDGDVNFIMEIVTQKLNSGSKANVKRST